MSNRTPIKPYADLEEASNGPIGAGGSYAAAFSGYDVTGYGNYVGMQSKTINLNGYVSATLSYGIQAGGNENVPESTDDLTVQYRNSSGTWVTLRTEDVATVSQTSFTARSITLPAAALQSNFAIRFYAGYLEGSYCVSISPFGGLCTLDIPAPRDFWYIDDVKVVGNRAPTISFSGTGTAKDNVNSTMGWTATDPDGDSMTVTAQLFKNGALLRSYSGTPPASGSMTVNKTDGPGAYTLKVSAKDSANVMTGPLTSNSLTITDDDAAGPQISLTGNAGSQLTSQDQRFVWSITDPSDSTSTVTIVRSSPVAVSDAIATSATPSGWTLTTSANGNRTYTRSYNANVVSDFFDFNALGVGNYIITINATDKDNDRSSDTTSSNSSSTVNVLSSPPVAVFTVTTPVNNWVEGASIVFDSAGSYDPDGSPLNIVWKFGDGTFAQGPVVSHVFTEDLPYDVVMTATNVLGVSITTNKLVRVANTAPTLTASISPTVAENSPIELSLATYDPGKDTTMIQVNWGDGFIDEYSVGGTKQHVYANGGQHPTIRISLQDEDGVYADQFVKTIDILDTSPVVSLPSFWTGEADVSVGFSATVTDGVGDTLTYTWDFGDGSTQTGDNLSNPTHAYSLEGIYDVSLTVLDSDGLSTTKTSRVGIGAPVTFDSTGSTVAEEGGSVVVSASLEYGIPLDHDVTIPLIMGGTAAPSDFAATVREILIPAGEITGSISLQIIDDNLDENDETLTVSMGLPQGAGRGTIREHQIGIHDNDEKPTLFLNTASRIVDEFDQVVMITADLSEVSGRDVIVPVSFTGTATTQDYVVPSPAQITIPAGALSASMPLRIIDDANVESAESINIALLASPQADLSTAIGQSTTATIIVAANDTPAVTFDSAYRLTAEGIPAIEIHARLTHFTDLPVTVPFTISGTATNGLDYAITSTTLTFPPGSIDATISVTITDDQIAEGTEFFFIEMQNVTNATQGTSQSVLTNILDNDLVRISFDVGDVSRYEGTGNLPIYVRLSNPSTIDTTVNVVRTGTAREGTDFSVNSWQVIIPAGSTTGVFNVNLLDDSENELAETLFLTIDSIEGTNVALGDNRSKAISILDNDPKLSLIASETSFSENRGSTTLTLQLSAPSNRDITVPLNYGGTASRNNDFTAPSSVLIAAGTTSKTFTISVTDDDTVESTETLSVAVGNLVGATTTAQKSVSMSILDNDEAPTVYWVYKTYRTSENSPLRTLTVGLTKATSSNVTVNLSYAGATAQSGEDFNASPTSVVIPAGALSAEFQVGIVNNEIREDSESFNVVFASVSNAVLPIDANQRSAEVIISDDDRLTAAELQVINQQLSDNDRNGGTSLSNGIPSWRDIIGAVNQPPDSGGNPNDPAYQDRALDYLLMGIGALPIPGIDVAAVVVQHFRDEYPDGHNWINANDIGRDYQQCVQNVTMENCGLFTNLAVTIGRHYLLKYLGNQLGEILEEGIGALGEYIGKGLVSIASGLTQDQFQDAYEGLEDAGNELVTWVKGLGGYADGAVIFFDTDFNGLRSANEPFGTTTADGYALVRGIEVADLNGNRTLDFNEGQWVTVGGIDVSINQEFRIPFVGPANFSTLTPSSTLVSKLLEIGSFSRTGLGIRAAEQRFFSAFGITDTPLAQFDFVHAAANGSTDAAKLFAVDTQIYDTVIASASLFQGVATSFPFEFLANVVLSDIAGKISGTGASLDLTRSAILQNILQGVNVRLGSTVDGATIAAAADAIARTNELISDIPLEGSEAYLRSVVKVQSLAQGPLANLLSQMSSSAISVSQFEADTATLEDQAAAAPAFNMLPVYLGIAASQSSEGDAGTRTIEFIVTPFATSALPISVDYQTGNGSAEAGADYDSATGTLNWAAGDSTPKSILVTIHGDEQFEADEYFSLFLSNVSNATLLSSVMRGTIVNDDAYSHSTPALQANELTVEVDGANVSLVENGVELFAGRFESGVTLELFGHALDSVTIVGANTTSFERRFELSDTQTLVVGEQTIRLHGITSLAQQVFADIHGLPAEILAGDTLVLSAVLPTAMNASAMSYHWALFAEGSSTAVSEETSGEFRVVPIPGHYRLELIVSDGVTTTTVVRSFEAIKPNVAPVAVDDDALTNEDVSYTWTQDDLKANDSDVDNINAELTIVAVSDAINGTVLLNSNGTVTFIPAANFNGIAEFSYLLSDGSLSDSGHVLLTVIPVNDAPTTENDAYSTNEDSPLTLLSNDLTLNDSDIDSASSDLVVTSVSDATHGSVTLHEDGTVTFTPATDYFGIASFVYTLSDGESTTMGQVTISVSPINDAPFAENDLFSTLEDSPFTLTTSELISNDLDIDNASSDLVVTSVSGATHGSVTLHEDGTVTFTPETDYFGTAGFDYTLSDGALTTIGHVIVHISPVNDAPVAENDLFSIDEDLPIALTASDLIANDGDVDNDVESLAVTAVGAATNGTVMLNSDGTVRFTPAANFYGIAGFDYTLSDGELQTVGHVAITVRPVNDVPVVSVDYGVVALDEGATAQNSGTFSDIDALDQVSLSASIGTVEKTATGGWTWRMVTNDSGQFQVVTITASDGQGGMATTAFNLVVNNLNPVITDLSTSGSDLRDPAMNGTVSLYALFSDAGIADTHRATILWGDGTQTVLAEDDVRIDQVQDSLRAWHTYSSGGVFNITLSVMDDDGGTIIQTTTAYIVGAGVQNGVLQIVGTREGDKINVTRQGASQLKVQAAFIPSRQDTFSLSGVNSILVLLSDGDDKLSIADNIGLAATIDGGYGNDDIRSGGGDDVIVDMYGHNEVRAGSGDDDITTGPGNDSIWSDSGSDAIHAGDGNNEIRTSGGSDLVVTGNGNDAIWTDGGGDTIRAGDGNNEIHAGRGNNVITAGSGNDQIWANGGDDTIDAGDGNNEIHAGRGRNIVISGNGNDQIWTNGDDDTIHAGNGNNEIHAGLGNNVITAGSGHDQIWTNNGDDYINAGDGNNEIHAGSGNNVVIAGMGNNQVWTTSGNDLITLGFGSNEVHAGAGNDQIITGAGNDQIWGESGDDVIDAGDGNNQVDAGSGNDRVTTGSGQDIIDAGAGDDIVRAGVGNDIVQGGAGNDILLGGEGNDQLDGSAGRDILMGGTGADKLLGSSDEDLLIGGYTSYDNNDTALAAIMREWAGTGSFAVRVSRLQTGTAITGGWLLNGNNVPAQTVFNDNDVDEMTGNAGQDWFFGNQVADDGGPLDKVLDKSSNEQWDDTDF